MPTISMFYGIVIRMYWNEHRPPHFHAYYQGNEAAYDLEGNLLNGAMPRKQERLIVAWVELHYEELLANWELAENDDEPYRIDPLR